MRSAILIEDSPSSRDALSAMLEEAGVEVAGSAEAEQEAVELLCGDGASADLVILDLFLAKGSGMGVLARTRGIPRRGRLAVLTNHAAPAIRQRCLAMGADAVFDKSTEIDSLEAFVKEGCPRGAPAMR